MCMVGVVKSVSTSEEQLNYCIVNNRDCVDGRKKTVSELQFSWKSVFIEYLEKTKYDDVTYSKNIMCSGCILRIFRHYIIDSLDQPYEVATVMVIMTQVMEMKHQVLKSKQMRSSKYLSAKGTVQIIFK